MLFRVSRLQVHEAILWAILAPAGHRLKSYLIRGKGPEGWSKVLRRGESDLGGITVLKT